MRTSQANLKKSCSSETPSIAHYLKVGKRKFATQAQKLAIIEQAADLEAGRLVVALIARMPNSLQQTRGVDIKQVNMFANFVRD